MDKFLGVGLKKVFPGNFCDVVYCRYESNF